MFCYLSVVPSYVALASGLTVTRVTAYEHTFGKIVIYIYMYSLHQSRAMIGEDFLFSHPFSNRPTVRERVGTRGTITKCGPTVKMRVLISHIRSAASTR